MARRILLGCLLLAACGNDGPEGARLRVTVVGDAERAGGLAQRLVAEATQPGLVARDGAGQVVAGLATSWRFVDDGEGLILRLRPVKWSDGEPLVARDVVAAFRRAGTKKDPVLARVGLAGAPAVLAGKAPVAKLGVMAPIARVVELRLDSVSPLSLAWLAEPGLGVMSTKKDVTLADYAVAGTPAQRLLKRRGMAATPEARPAVIALTATDDVTAAVAGFVQGRADIVMGEGLAGLGEARIAARGEALRIDPVWGVYGYVVNGLKGVTADARVRRALVLAVDRPALAGRFGLGAIAPAGSPVPPALGGPADRGGDDMAVRIGAARAMLTEAGWTEANPLRLVLLLPPGRDHRVVAEQVAADWARVGVLLAVTEVDAAAYDKAVKRGDFDLAVTEASVPVPDAAALLARWRCGSPSYCNPVADGLIEDARLAPAAARPALLGRAEAAMMATPPLIPLFTPVRWSLVARNVEGWTPNRAASHPLARLAVGRRR